MRTARFLLALASLAALLVFAAPAWADTIYVPRDYKTIQEAVDAAARGDTVWVAAGVYEETVIIDQAMTLCGAGSESTIIDGGGAGHVIQVVSDDDIYIRRLAVRNGSRSGRTPASTCTPPAVASSRIARPRRRGRGSVSRLAREHRAEVHVHGPRVRRRHRRHGLLRQHARRLPGGRTAGRPPTTPTPDRTASASCAARRRTAAPASRSAGARAGWSSAATSSATGPASCWTPRTTASCATTGSRAA